MFKSLSTHQYNKLANRRLNGNIAIRRYFCEIVWQAQECCRYIGDACSITSFAEMNATFSPIKKKITIMSEFLKHIYKLEASKTT